MHFRFACLNSRGKMVCWHTWRPIAWRGVSCVESRIVAQVSISWYILKNTSSTHIMVRMLGWIIVWQRNWPNVRIAYCPSIRVLWDRFLCYRWKHKAVQPYMVCNITRDVTIELANWLGIVNWCWLLIQPFARQAVRWGPFILSWNTSNFNRTSKRGMSRAW